LHDPSREVKMRATAEPEVSKSLAGMTLRWRFDEGPTAGTVYEHTFRPDGTVVWRDVGKPEPSGKNAKDASGVKYASFEVAPATHLVSYRAESGYTLTVALNFETQKCFGAASSSKEWYPLSGTLETD
jgi:hypothetical protein